MRKKWKQILALLLCTTCGGSLISMKAIHADTDDTPHANSYTQTSQNQGVAIGSVIYDMDENGNIIERVITDEGAVTLEEAEKEYYMDFYGNGEETIEDLKPYKLVGLDANTGKETLVGEYANLTDAEKAYNDQIIAQPTLNFAIKSQDTYHKIKYAVLQFKKIKDANNYIKNINYTEEGTNIGGYTNPSYSIDAVVLDKKDDLVKFQMGGVIGWVDASKVEIEPYKETVNYVSFYQVTQGKLYHKIKSGDITTKDHYSSTVMVGYAPSYLKDKVVYYSYDGHYFYTDYFKMIDDIRAGTKVNAMNPDQPYYNYFQFLPMHSQSNYSEADLNQYIASRYNAKPTTNDPKDLKKDQSLLYNEGRSFIKAEVFGVNPVMAMGVAINESGWGRSSIAIKKNNLFGLNAVDSNPSEAADVFESAEECIEVFGKQWVTWGYLDTDDWRYFGGHLGDKSSGMNVKYASDPYWGEKAAANSYAIDEFLEKKDYQQYTLGLKEMKDDLIIRQTSSASSKPIYQMKNKSYSVRNLPVIILEEQAGDAVNGNPTWYKIYTDHPLNDKQEKIIFDNDHLTESFAIPYDFNQSQGYVSAAFTRKIITGRGLPTVPEFPVDPEEPEIPETPVYPKGDVNGDFAVEADDYMLIKLHVLGRKMLAEDQLERANIDGGEIEASDYMLIKLHVLGRQELK